MKHHERTFKGCDHLNLFWQRWLPRGRPRPTLIVVHGLAEHGSRYGNFVSHFVPRGYAVYAHDLRGHGRSEGRRCFVNRFQQYVDDLDRFLDIVKQEQPATRIFLAGHSMGGTISVAYAIEHQDRLAGLILSGSALAPGSSISPVQLAIVRALSRLAPRLGVASLKASGISRDEEVVTAYVNDPLVFKGKITARLGGELLSMMRTLPERTPVIKLPVLIMHGAEDVMSQPQGSRLLCDQVSSQDKTLVLYEGLHHEIYNEPERESVFADVEAWLVERT